MCFREIIVSKIWMERANCISVIQSIMQPDHRQLKAELGELRLVRKAYGKVDFTDHTWLIGIPRTVNNAHREFELLESVYCTMQERAKDVLSRKWVTLYSPRIS